MPWLIFPAHSKFSLSTMAARMPRLRNFPRPSAATRVFEFFILRGTKARPRRWRRVSAIPGARPWTLDGDLQNDPADIPKLLEKLKDWDVVCGIRIHRQDSPWKRISSRIANEVRNWVTGDNIIDTGCTLKAFRGDCVRNLELYQGMHRFLPTLLKMRGYRVIQIPVSHHPRLHGKTKYGTWRRLVKGLADLYAVRWMKANWIDPH